MKKTALRKEKLMEFLSAQGRADVRSVTRHFSISEATARRMFTALESEGKIIRTHGGIVMAPCKDQEYLYDDLFVTHIREKKAIGEYAASLVEDNDVVFLEAGTTVQQVAIALAERIKSGNVKNVRIFTNSLVNIDQLATAAKVIATGGEYRPNRKDFNGLIGERAIRNLRFSKCFVGSDAINLTDGVMATDIDTVRFDELLISRSDRSIIVADSSKFMKRSLLSYAPTDQVSVLITDNKLKADIFHLFTEAGITVIKV